MPQTDELTERLAEQGERRWYGKYRGVVVDNEDPEGAGRIRLRVPSVFGDAETGWALPCVPYGGADDQGQLMVPDPGALVWVEFEEGNVDAPIWVGTLWGSHAPPAGGTPTTRIIRTAAGHELVFDDAAGDEAVRLTHSTGAQLAIDADGTVSLTDAADNNLTLDARGPEITCEDATGNRISMTTSGIEITDASGNSVALSPSGIEVSGLKVSISASLVDVGGSGGEPLIKGTTFLGLFNSHVHNCTAPGAPSGPPLPPLTPAVLTLTTKAT